MSEIKSQPTPGYLYKVKYGRSDWIYGLAERAYGDGSKWQIIAQANQQLVQGPDAGKTDISKDRQWFTAGDVVFIPPLVEKEKPKRISGKGPDDFTIVIDGIEVPVISGKILRTMDTAADGWTATIPWTPGKDALIDKITSPFFYPSSQAYIGNEVLVNGKLYEVSHSLDDNGRTKDLEGFSKTADIIDSNMQPPYEKSNVTILQRAKELCRPHGIDVIVDTGVDIGGKFSRVTASENDTIFKHLNDLAVQRSLLLSCNEDGNLLITKAKTDSKIVGTLTEGDLPSQEFKVKFSGRARFGTYKVLSQTPKKKAKASSVSKDTVVPGSRFSNVSISDNTQGEIKNVADWVRNKNLVETLTIQFPVSGWYAPDGTLWKPNSQVAVQSETIGTGKNGFVFLIHRVEYIFEESGRKANLFLLPPEVYTGEAIKEPWIK